MSLRRNVWIHKTILTPPLFIELPVPSLESDQERVYVLGVSILTLCTIFVFHFGIVPTVWYFFSHLLTYNMKKVSNVEDFISQCCLFFIFNHAVWSVS